MRHVYLDTEFLTADPTTRGLVSIALTDDSDTDYYAVNAQMDTVGVYNQRDGDGTYWMRENVWPYVPNLGRVGLPGQLDRKHPVVKPITEIAAEVAEYFAGDDETYLYANYGAQDAFRLHSLWNHHWGNMPKQIPRWFFDIKALRVQAGNPDVPRQKAGAHNPLDDARHNRTVHQHLRNLTPTGTPGERARGLPAGQPGPVGAR